MDEAVNLEFCWFDRMTAVEPYQLGTMPDCWHVTPDLPGSWNCGRTIPGLSSSTSPAPYPLTSRASKAFSSRVARRHSYGE
ncbi:hypothetical protein IG631_21454 [Alternaria alternata]|nr:hypothetical protein IG631_21454 [Alternaria alternata]